MLFRHPKYYEELRKIKNQFEKEQAAKAAGSKPTSSQAQAGKRPGHKQQAEDQYLPSKDS